MKFLADHHLLKNMFFYNKCYYFFLLLCGFAVNSFAQGGNGKVTGKVLDATTNETLIGVSVKAVGTTFGASTIVDGSYILTLPAGTYTITYKYVGYQPKEISGIVVKTGQSTFQNIILNAASQQIQEVVVRATAKKESQSSVYSAQKRSSAVSDGISQEAIRRTPDNNAAQVLTRVTGVNVQDNKFVVVRGLGNQYNQTMLNGVQMTSTETDRNAFAFDLIPASVIDNIVVNKTATPDMPGNFAGGVVQVNTKDFPDNNFLSISLQSGYSDGTYGKDFYSDKRTSLEWLGFGGNSRNLPKGFPTATSRNNMYDMNVQEQFRHFRTLNNNLIAVNNGPSTPNIQGQIGYGRTINLKNGNNIGIVLALNQRKTELIEQEIAARSPDLFNGSIRGVGRYSDHLRYTYSSNFGGVVNLAYRFGNNKITLKNLYTTVFRNSYINRPNSIITFFPIEGNQTNVLQGIQFLTEQRGILNNTLGGEHRMGKKDQTRLDWNINSTYNITNMPDSKNFMFIRDTVTSLYSSAGDQPDISEILSMYGRGWANANDVIYGGAFNVTTPVVFLNKKHLFKGGILYQNRNRDASGTLLPLSIGKATTIDSIFNSERIHPTTLGYLVTQQAEAEKGANYLAGSSLWAAYESMETHINNKFRVIWGLRVENYQQNTNLYKKQFNDYFKDADFKTVEYAARSTFNFLPSVNVVYNPVNQLNIRAAFSNTTIRPELRDLLAALWYNFKTLSQSTGNPFLKSTFINNYDLKLEWFPSGGEIISIGAFYKNLKNPIEYAEGSDDRLPTDQAVNSGNAYVRGIEAEVRKKLDFIPSAPWLSHLSLFGNGTLLKSKVEASSVRSTRVKYVAEHTLSGQPDYILNIGMSVLGLKNTFEASLSYNKTADYLSSLGSDALSNLATDGKTLIPLNPNYRISSRELLDLVISKHILKRKGQFRFKASNLLNTPFVMYQDLNANKKFDEPVTVRARYNNKGVNDPTTEINNYAGGIDNTPSYIRPQRTYSLSFAYTF